jgi:hypothetical protein
MRRRDDPHTHTCIYTYKHIQISMLLKNISRNVVSHASDCNEEKHNSESKSKL